ncbi:hypothetical protein Salat_1932300 [Sesamum alatum]|uniref:Uncharacterized protein n=1 Tax=Sesamum alatum TaxID=300844 RepID=A0AAE1Y4M4_9LAMI|nr:hypothetical protein Salat_1932300 [Sesamum alatum]
MSYRRINAEATADKAIRSFRTFRLIQTALPRQPTSHTKTSPRPSARVSLTLQYNTQTSHYSTAHARTSANYQFLLKSPTNVVTVARTLWSDSNIMGNFISCTFVAPKLRSPKSARVILPGGEIRQFRQPVKAAELMLESPNFFLVNSKSLNIGRRFSPLSADEDLEFGNLYVMIPMRRVNSIVTAADGAVFLMAANSAPKRISGGNSVKVSPEAAVAPADHDSSESERPRLSLEGLALEYKYRLAVCRSKRPGLDTITEEPVFSR